ncbi:copper chaperone PCu(A)C [Francisella philomiragia]|uniref:copper chaperone PCu(A)C n=1 Tax=Francisella philomiragia TaxID=28110 RepID=UPI001B8B4176|nr:copper chaperone PCu(A)C [Francisella philomiragia]QUE31052.1 copper chaperone PCu(A)C [Francisella philomiragia]
MKKIILSITTILAIVSFGFSNTKNQCNIESCELSITHAEVKETNSNNTAIKMHIKNSGDKTVDIIAAYSPVDRQTQLHHFVTIGNKRVMKQIKTIEIYPHNSVDLSYQELHVMLIGLKQKITKGQKIPVMLILEDGSTLSTTAIVD